MRERIDEDTSFALSISEPHPEPNEESNDPLVDGPEFDDDPAILTQELVDRIRTSQATDQSDVDVTITQDNEGNFIVAGGEDEELTDHDADGDTDEDLDYQFDDFDDLKDSCDDSSSAGFDDVIISYVPGIVYEEDTTEYRLDDGEIQRCGFSYFGRIF